jgi:hypothetical protein
VCDANDHVVCLPKFLGPVLPKLRTGGWVVLTLKFHGRGLKNDDLPARLAHLLPVSHHESLFSLHTALPGSARGCPCSLWVCRVGKLLAGAAVVQCRSSDGGML